MRAILSKNAPILSASETNVTEQFLVWFFVGFIICCLTVCAGLLTHISACLRDQILPSLIVLMLGCGTSCTGLFWIIGGCLLRFSRQGQICSGEFTNYRYLMSDRKALMKMSGHFIKTILILMLVTLGIFYLFACCFMHLEALVLPT